MSAIELLEPEAWEVPTFLSRDECRGHTGLDGLIPCRTDDEEDDDR